jgi:hypothetical protein
MAKELEEQGIKMVPIWNTREDEIVCPICGPRNGLEITDDEYPPIHPNCLPGNTFVLSIGRVSAGSKRWYEGDIVIIDAAEHTLSVTPNHPILTRRGWVPAGEIIKGDELLCYGWGNYSIPGNPDEQKSVACIKNIFSALSFGDFRVPVAPPDFHGDGANSEVAVIRANSKVDSGDIAEFYQKASNNPLTGGDIISFVPLSGFGSQDFSIQAKLNASDGVMGGLDLVAALLGGHIAPLDNLGLGLSTGSDTIIEQVSSDSSSADTIAFREAILALPGKVSLDKVIRTGKCDFAGHVYNLQTETGLFVADGIITHNCRCTLSHELPKGEA